MNIKIKAAGVTCLVGEDYNRVYATLVKNLGPLGADFFTERVPGHEYLQWELPGEGWISLGEADPLMANEVRQELIKRKQEVSARFAANQAMAQRILTVPDETYVYYRPNAEGGLDIRLTAWGYRYPERIMGAELDGIHSNTKTEPVVIHTVYDGQPLPEEEIKLNGFSKVTDKEGVYQVGDLPVGYQFDVEARTLKLHVTVMPGQGTVILDLTEQAEVEVLVNQDGLPFIGAEVTLQYRGEEVKWTTDENGRAMGNFAIDPAGSACIVKVGEETQESPLVASGISFRFDLVAPEPNEAEAPAGPPEEPALQLDPVERTLREEPVPAEKGGMPLWLLLLLLILMTAATFCGCYFLLF